MKKLFIGFILLQAVPVGMAVPVTPWTSQHREVMQQCRLLSSPEWRKQCINKCLFLEDTALQKCIENVTKGQEGQGVSGGIGRY